MAKHMADSIEKCSRPELIYINHSTFKSVFAPYICNMIYFYPTSMDYISKSSHLTVFAKTKTKIF